LNNNTKINKNTKRSLTMKKVSSYQWKQNANEINNKVLVKIVLHKIATTKRMNSKSIEDISKAKRDRKTLHLVNNNKGKE
jgi:hypothetical protein